MMLLDLIEIDFWETVYEFSLQNLEVRYES